MRAATCLAAPLLSLGLVVQGAGPGARTIVRYVANAGMLVTVEGHDVLLDAPIREGIAPYPTSPPDQRQRLESARPPYDRVEAILITHWHEDHFSADAIAAQLIASPHTIVISSPEVIGRVRQAAPQVAPARLRAVLPAPGGVERLQVGGLAIRVLRIRHNPTRRLPEQHVGFLIGDRRAVLHVGDADPAPDNFALLRGLPGVEVALLPYWYVLTDSGRRLVSASIAPGRIVAMHMPTAEGDTLRRAIAGWERPVGIAGTPGQVVRDLTLAVGSSASGLR